MTWDSDSSRTVVVIKLRRTNIIVAGGCRPDRDTDTARRLRQDRRNCRIASIRRAIRRLHRAAGRVKVRGAGAEERVAFSASKLA